MTRPGIWTQFAEVLCSDCADHVGHGAKMKMEGTLIGFCDHCHAPIIVDEAIGREHELMYLARQAGFTYSCMSQTGGMCHALEITVQESAFRHIYIFSVTYQGADDWYMEIYENQEMIAERTASSMSEILDYALWVRRGNYPCTSSDLQ